MNFYESAIDKIHQAESGRTGIYLNSYEYSELLSRASVAGNWGQAARDAFACARAMDYRPFALVSSRSRAKEEEYAKMGRAPSSGCFLTTACMEKLSESFDDNCRELTVLRRYRDSWLKENHPDDIRRYYQAAPRLVEEINALPSPRPVWLALYDNGIMPAVRAIEAGENEKAYIIYRAMVEGLESVFLPF